MASTPDDRERYAAYLCSREWAERREAVRERAKNKCERCGILPMDSCHHLTYARKYNEPLEDLQAICNLCHEFTHGKSDFDPVDENEQNWLRYLEICRNDGEQPVPYRFCNNPGCEFDVGTAGEYGGWVYVVHVLKQAADNITSLGSALVDGCDGYETALKLRDLIFPAITKTLHNGPVSVLPYSYARWLYMGRPTPRTLDFYKRTIKLFGLNEAP